MQWGGIGEHVALGERAGLGVPVAQPRDAVVHSRPPVVEQPRELRRVDVDLVGADVLDHADAGDRVELLAGQIG